MMSVHYLWRLLTVFLVLSSCVTLDIEDRFPETQMNIGTATQSGVETKTSTGTGTGTGTGTDTGTDTGTGTGTGTEPDAQIPPLERCNEDQTEQGIIYVRAGATGNATGATWEDAFASLVEALIKADETLEENGAVIWVAAGTYKPGTSRDSTFRLRPNLIICGGYSGTANNERSIIEHRSILSCKIGAEDDADNCHHVVSVESDGDHSSVLDGFYITGGHAKGGSSAADHSGGGIRISDGDALIKNCVVRDNTALDFGGGIYISNGSPAIINSVIVGNRATQGAGVFSGGTAGEPRLVNVTIAGNELDMSGAGTGLPLGDGVMVLIGPEPHIFNALIWDDVINTAGATTIPGPTVGHSCLQHEYLPNESGGFIEFNTTIGNSPFTEDVKGADATWGTIDDEPLFVHADRGCTDAGSGDVVVIIHDDFDLDGDGKKDEELSIQEVAPKDLADNPRILHQDLGGQVGSDSIDAGAFEYDPESD
jgi:hypothetical protein